MWIEVAQATLQQACSPWHKQQACMCIALRSASPRREGTGNKHACVSHCVPPGPAVCTLLHIKHACAMCIALRSVGATRDVCSDVDDRHTMYVSVARCRRRWRAKYAARRGAARVCRRRACTRSRGKTCARYSRSRTIVVPCTAAQRSAARGHGRHARRVSAHVAARRCAGARSSCAGSVACAHSRRGWAQLPGRSACRPRGRLLREAPRRHGCWPGCCGRVCSFKTIDEVRQLAGQRW